MKLIITFIVAIFIILNSNTCNSDDIVIYYIRLDNKVRNGILIENNLLMTPAKEEFRITSFKKYRAAGISSDNDTNDALASAKHDAIKNLLQEAGVKSIKNMSVTDKSTHNDEMIFSYEGFIKTPYSVVSQGYTNESQRYEVAIDVYFSPMAYPSEWNFNYFKKKVYDFIHNMISVFF